MLKCALVLLLVELLCETVVPGHYVQPLISSLRFIQTLTTSLRQAATRGGAGFDGDTVGKAAVETAKAFYDKREDIYCDFNECCRPEWINYTWRGLLDDLDNKLFGQHIVPNIVLTALDEFMNNPNPKKPLVLSLHGTTGTGKNLVSQLIAKNIYKKGMKSKFVHFFRPALHFPHLHIYKFQLKKFIEEGVTDCERSMFIFDNVDLMRPKLTDCIKPYLGKYDKLDGVSIRKAIFIFLSNAEGNSIAQTAFDSWKARRKRQEIDLKLLDGHFQSTSTRMIDKNLVDFFVPFLPLEYEHVVQCIKAEMKDRGLQPNMDIVDKVAKDFHYFPKSERVFSVKGCKTMDSKLDKYL